jgi:hypothetical protein
MQQQPCGLHSSVRSYSLKLLNLVFVNCVEIGSVPIWCNSLYKWTLVAVCMADKRSFQTSTDGNCLFNSVSIATFGDQSKAAEFRVLTCIEMLEHSDYYKRQHKTNSSVRSYFLKLLSLVFVNCVEIESVPIWCNSLYKWTLVAVFEVLQWGDVQMGTLSISTQFTKTKLSSFRKYDRTEECSPHGTHVTLRPHHLCSRNYHTIVLTWHYHEYLCCLDMAQYTRLLQPVVLCCLL